MCDVMIFDMLNLNPKTDGKCQTLNAYNGTGGNNMPLVMMKAYGVTTKGNGDAFINEKTHTALNTGGGQAGQGYPCVLILNPSDSQGNQIADYRGVYPTLRGCGGAGYQLGYVLAPKGKQITLTEKRFFHWVEDDVSVTLRNHSGSYGGGSEVLVIRKITEPAVKTPDVKQEITGTDVKNDSNKP